jgi:hypothetical protein
MTKVFVHMVFVRMGISLDGFAAGVNRGPHIPLSHMAMKVHEWMFPAGEKAAATGSRASANCTGIGCAG